MDSYKEQEIVRMYQAGLSVVVIAAETEVSITTIRSVIKLHGLEKPEKPPAQGDDLVGIDYTTNMPVPELLQKHSITYQKLYTILDKLNIPLRSHASIPSRQAFLDQAVQMYQDGIPLWKIQDETGVHQPTLHAALHTRNIPLRRPR